MGWRVNPHVYIYRAFDMGYFPDPAYCVWLAHLGDRYIAFKERLWYKTVASDIARDIKEDSDGMRTRMTFCDPTIDIRTGTDVRTIKDIFEEHGVPMECSVNNREHYAHAIHTALSEEAAPGVPRLQIYKAGCPYLIKTLPQQRYDPKRPLAMANHKHDHAAIALAYFLISMGSMERKPLPEEKSRKLWMVPKARDRYVLGRDNMRRPRK